MKFEKLIEDGRLWAAQYEGDDYNAFDLTFSQWTDVKWLKDFFTRNINDLSSYFHITDLDEAIFDTIDDVATLECLMLDINPDVSLDEIFRPLENFRINEALLGREKVKGHNEKHASWLRLYAIKLQPNRYIITGGAIKLTAMMQDREHTLIELAKLNKVREHLLSLGIVDYEGFLDNNNDDDRQTVTNT